MILDELAEAAKKRSLKDQQIIPPKKMKALAKSLAASDFPFRKALSKPGLSFICELKKASPSKGIIAEQFDPESLAKEYEAAGADCLSVLTEPGWFLGSDEILQNVRRITSLPILRKDFLVDSYMIDQARVLGADAVLLIVSLLDQDQLKDYIRQAEKLGMDALVEAHDEDEVRRALEAGARIIGINNRNLRDFSINMDNAANLSGLIGENVLFVSESGIQTAADVAKCKAIGADAVLIGETLMRAPDKKRKLDGLKNGQA